MHVYSLYYVIITLLFFSLGVSLNGIVPGTSPKTVTLYTHAYDHDIALTLHSRSAHLLQTRRYGSSVTNELYLLHVLHGSDGDLHNRS